MQPDEARTLAQQVSEQLKAELRARLPGYAVAERQPNPRVMEAIEQNPRLQAMIAAYKAVEDDPISFEVRRQGRDWHRIIVHIQPVRDRVELRCFPGPSCDFSLTDPTLLDQFRAAMGDYSYFTAE